MELSYDEQEDALYKKVLVGWTFVQQKNLKAYYVSNLFLRCYIQLMDIDNHPVKHTFILIVREHLGLFDL